MILMHKVCQHVLFSETRGSCVLGKVHAFKQRVYTSPVKTKLKKSPAKVLFSEVLFSGKKLCISACLQDENAMKRR